MIFVVAPIPIVLISKFTSSSEQNFGKTGSLMTKVLIVLVVAVTLSKFHPMPSRTLHVYRTNTMTALSTAIRIAGTFSPTRPASNPYWFETRAAFYVFLGVLEVFTVALYTITQVDQRFFVPGKAERLAEEKNLSMGPAGVPHQV